MAKKIKQKKTKVYKNPFTVSKPPKKMKVDATIMLICYGVKFKKRASWDTPPCEIFLPKGTNVDFIEGVNPNSCLLAVEIGGINLHIVLPYDVLA